MYLYGASGHAKVVIDILEKSGVGISGLFDDDESITELLGYSCAKYSYEKVLQEHIVITIGDNKIRSIIANKLRDISFGTAVDLFSTVSDKSLIGKGSVIMAGAIINSCCDIGLHNIINTNSSVDHDCILGDFVHISPGVSIAGGVRVEEGTHIGIGACVLQNVKIGRWCVIGAGAVIIRDIPDYSVVVGNPGRLIKTIKFGI